MNKKGMTLEEMVKLIIAVALLVVFTWLIVRIISPAPSQTESSFKTLGAEINLLIEDLEDEDTVQITVPVFIEKEYAIGAINEDATIYPTKCKGQSCLVLARKTDLNKIITVIKFGEVEFGKLEEYIKSPQDSVVKVKVVGQKQDSKKIITLEQIPEEQTS